MSEAAGAAQVVAAAASSATASAPLVGQVAIRGMAARCVIGANAWERRRRQRVVVDVVFEADLGAAAAGDDLRDAIDYKRVKDRVLALVAASRFHLLEALAAAVADLVMGDPRVRAAEATVAKPGALTGARTVAVRVARRRA